MCCGPYSVNAPTLFPPPAHPVDWDRLWRHTPSDTKDDALLARERRSPRWASIVNKLEITLGSIKGLRTIELGSGRGDLSALLAESGAKVTLLDSSDKALSQARHRFDRLGLEANFQHGDMFRTPQSLCGRFDVALSSGVIEHFRSDDRTRAVQAHYEVLASKGVAIISVPNAWCIPYRVWKLYLELRGWWPYGLELPYSRRELMERARRVGFERIEGRCMGFWQSVGDQLGKNLLGWRPDWVDRRSFMDGAMGLVLLLFAWRWSGRTLSCAAQRPVC
jgi:SAM-dependent methyltransferase